MLLARVNLVGARSSDDGRVAFGAISNALLVIEGGADEPRVQILSETTMSEVAFGSARTSPPASPLLLVDIQGVPQLERQETFRTALRDHLAEHANFRLDDVLVSFPATPAVSLRPSSAKTDRAETPLKRLSSFIAALAS